MKEIFKDIPTYEGIYQVSNLGNVKSLNRRIWNKRNNCYSEIKGINLKARIGRSGYYTVCLSKNEILCE